MPSRHPLSRSVDRTRRQFHRWAYEVSEPNRYVGPAAARPEPAYVMMLPQIDRLAALLFEHTGYSPDFLRSQLAYGMDHAETYLRLNNATPLPDVTPPKG